MRQMATRKVMRAMIRPLVSWEPMRDPIDGYTVIIGCTERLMSMLWANLLLLNKLDLTGCDKVILVVDCLEEEIKSEWREKAREVAPNLNIEFVGYTKAQYRVAKRIDWGWVYAWLNWSLGIARTRTRHAFLHDFDALLLSRTAIVDRWREIKRLNVHYLGVGFYEGRGVLPSDRLVRTFEMMFDASFVRERCEPLELFNLTGRIGDREVEFDTFLFAQRKIGRGEVMPLPGAELVHPSQMICQFVDFRAGRAVPDRHNLLMIPYYNALGGEVETLRRLTEELRSGGAVSLWGRELKPDAIPKTHAEWMHHQGLVIEGARGEGIRDEVRAYFDAILARAGGAARNGALGPPLTPPVSTSKLSNNPATLEPSSDVAEGMSAVAAPAPAVEPSLRSRTITGAIWTMGGYGFSQVVRLLGNIIVSKFVPASAYGLMSLVNPVLQGLNMFSDVGIGPNIIQHPRGSDPKFLRTAWTVQVIRGAVIWVVAVLLAFPTSKLYNEPLLLSVLPVVALTALINGFLSTSLFTMRRRLTLGKITILDLGTQLLGVVIMVVWAYFSPTVWALVVGSIGTCIVKLWLSHTVLRDNKDGFEIERDALHSLLHFGGWIFVSTLLTFLALQGDKLIFGKLVSLEELGVYQLAAMLARLPVDIVLNVGSSVVFPAYSQARNTGKDFVSVFRATRFSLCVGGLALVTLLAVTGPDLVRLLWTKPVWHTAAAYIPLLSMASIFQILEVTSGSALLAKGKAQYIALGSLAKVIGLAVLIPLGFYNHIPWLSGGIESAIVCIAGAEFARYLVSAVSARREGLPVFRFDVMLALGAVATYLLADLIGSRLISDPHDQGSVPRMVVEGLFVLAVFAGPLLLAVRTVRGRR